MQNKKILYVWQSSYPWEIRVDKTIQTLLSAGAEVILLCRQKKSESQTAGLKYYDLSNSKFNQPIPFSPIWTKRISEIIQTENIDLIISRDILITPSTLVAAKKLKVPVIMDMAEHYPAAMRGWKKYNSNLISKLIIHNLKAPDRVEQYCVRHCAGVMTVCQEQDQRLIALGAASESLCSIYNTPNLEIFPNTLVNPPTKILRFAHHGYLTPERGLDKAIEAFGILKKEAQPFELILAGSGECEPDLKNLAQRLNAPVHFTGSYSFSDFPQMISQIDVGILPYQLTEFLDHTVANKLFDYMAVGKPVLVSEAKALSRIARETGAGFVMNTSTPQLLANSIKDFAKQYRPEQGLLGRRAIENKYNWAVDQRAMLSFLSRYL